MKRLAKYGTLSIPTQRSMVTTARTNQKQANKQLDKEAQVCLGLSCPWAKLCAFSSAINTNRITVQAGIGQWVERPTEKPGAILTRVRVLAAARDFSSRINWTFLRCPYSPREQSHASVSVNTLEMPNIGMYIPLSGHKKILHTQK